LPRNWHPLCPGTTRLNIALTVLAPLPVLAALSDQLRIHWFGSQGAIFVPDIIMLAEKKENLRSVERMLRRFERAGPDTRSLPELVKQLEHNQDAVRLLAIKFLALAGPSAKEAIPALDRLREDHNAEVRKQAQAASDRIKSKAGSSQDNGKARKTAST
jgi:HEAT repeats